jgi:hypothetical protein
VPGTFKDRNKRALMALMSRSLSCPSASECVAVDGNQEVICDPMSPGNPTPATIPAIATVYGLGSISCPTATFCASAIASISGNPADAVVEGNPNDSSDPSVDHIIGAQRLSALSCSSPSQCVAVDGSGDGNAFVGTGNSGGGGGGSGVGHLCRARGFVFIR